QASDLHRLLAFGVQHACAFAKYRSGTDTAATVSENVSGQDGARRAHQVLSKDLPDELRNVDLSRTRLDAGRVVAEQTARAGLKGQRRSERRINVGEVLLELLRSEFGARMHQSPNPVCHERRVEISGA